MRLLYPTRKDLPGFDPTASTDVIRLSQVSRGARLANEDLRSSKRIQLKSNTLALAASTGIRRKMQGKVSSRSRRSERKRGRIPTFKPTFNTRWPSVSGYSESRIAGRDGIPIECDVQPSHVSPPQETREFAAACVREHPQTHSARHRQAPTTATPENAGGIPCKRPA